MSYFIPKVNPDSYDWLERQPLEKLTAHDFRLCALDYVRHMVESNGVHPAEFQDVDIFFKPGDLQTLANVVKDWPRKEGAPRAPNPASLLMSIRTPDGSTPYTFEQALGVTVARMRAWASANNLNPENPNETPKERSNRKTAERMRKMRARHAQTDVTDPEEIALLAAVRAAKANLATGRAWVKTNEDAAKAIRDAAISAAKEAYATTVSGYHVHLKGAAEQVQIAEAALDQYRSRT